MIKKNSMVLAATFVVVLLMTVIPLYAQLFPHLVQVCVQDRDVNLVGKNDVLGTCYVTTSPSDTLQRKTGTGGAWVVDCDGFNTKYGAGTWNKGDRLHIDFLQVAGSHPGDSKSLEFDTPPLDTNYPFVYSSCVTVPVELVSFEATASYKGVELKWRTETETENLGFHVFRSLTEDGEFSRINDEIIHGAGNSIEAHDYSYTDNDVLAGNTYYYKLADVDFNGIMTFHGPISAMVALPEEYALEQNYPNPFNPNTAIKFSIKEPGHVNLQIYNIQGQLVRTLVNKEYNAGHFSVDWEGTDDRGAKVASGIYLYKLEVNGFRQVKRLVFMK